MRAFFILVPLVVFELIARALLPTLPPAIAAKFAADDIANVRLEMVEFLNESPFAKFRANSNVRSQGSFGDPGEFSYEWRTDQRGFKNDPSVLEKGGVVVVAAGHSFDEGMGIPLEKTWAAQLHRRGIPTYSTGVQGYGTVQALGAFNKYGKDLKPKLVTIGFYSGGIFSDSSVMDIEKVRKTRRVDGGIQFIIDGELKRLGRIQYRLVVSAIIHAGLDALVGTLPEPLRFLHSDLFADLGPARLMSEAVAADPPAEPGDAELGLNWPEKVTIAHHYRAEARHFAKLKVPKDGWRNYPQWPFTKAAIEGFANQAEKVVLLYYPHRAITYYEAFIGPFPQDSGFVTDKQLIKELCDSLGIIFVDLEQPVLDYVKQLGPNAPMRQYPFFSHDSHFNPIGAAIVADVVEGVVEKHLAVKRRPGTIVVADGAYGRNCGVTAPNLTYVVGAECGGKARCTFPIKVEQLGDPAPGCGKDVTVHYSCGDGTPRVATVPAGAGFGERLELSCVSSQ